MPVNIERNQGQSVAVIKRNDSDELLLPHHNAQRSKKKPTKEKQKGQRISEENRLILEELELKVFIITKPSFLSDDGPVTRLVGENDFIFSSASSSDAPTHATSSSSSTSSSSATPAPPANHPPPSASILQRLRQFRAQEGRLSSKNNKKELLSRISQSQQRGMRLVR